MMYIKTRNIFLAQCSKCREWNRQHRHRKFNFTILQFIIRRILIAAEFRLRSQVILHEVFCYYLRIMCRHNSSTNPSFLRQINCDTKFVEGRCGLGGQRVGRGREGRRGQRWPGPGGSGREELSVITSQSGQFR